jgi:hypothetical protein
LAGNSSNNVVVLNKSDLSLNRELDINNKKMISAAVAKNIIYIGVNVNTNNTLYCFNMKDFSLIKTIPFDKGP